MRRLIALLMCIVGLAAASPSLASDHAGAGASPLVPSVVRAGESIELDWRLEDGEYEELELELSVGGGPWRRISPELHGLTRRFVWQVPDLAAESARIRLRVGTEHGEFDLAPSAEFRIERAAGVIEPASAAPTTGRAAIPGAIAGGAPKIRAAAEATPLEAPSRGPEVVAPSFDLPPVPDAAGPSGAPAPTRLRTRSPARYPLRN